MAWLRRLGWAAAAVAALLVLAVLAGWALFDAARLQQLAVDTVQQRYQRTLVIAQPIELAVLPRPRLKLAGVSLSERGRSEVFATIGTAELTPQLWPLLRGQVVVDAIALQGVRATLVTRRDGTRNIDDLLNAPAAPNAARTPSAGGSRIHIAHIRLNDLQLTLRDQAAGPPTVVQLTRLDATQLLVEGGAVSVGPLEVVLAGLQKGRLALSGAQLQLASLAYAGTSRRLALAGLRAAVVGRQGELGFEAALRWPTLAVEGERVRGSPLEGDLKTSGPTALTGTLKTGTPIGDLKALRLPDLVLVARGRNGPREIDGTLKAALVLQPERAALQLQGLDLQARLIDPGLQPLVLALQGQAGGTAEALRWALKGSLNDNRLQADGELRLAGKSPYLTTTARFDRLDLNRMLAPAAAAPAALASAPQAAAPAATPIVLEGLRALDGAFTVAAGELKFRQYRIAEARLDTTLAGGTLRVNRLAGRAWGGQIEGRGSADANGSRIALALTASGVDVNALLRDVAGKDLLEGRGRVTAELRGQGQTLGALRSSLAGQVAVQLRDGAVKGINLAKTFRQAKAALSMKQDAATQTLATEKTDFSELNVSARVEGGVARSDDLDLKSPFLRVGGAGQFDIGRGQVDYTARATVVAAPQGQDASGMAALKGVTVPVRLTGPFEAIDWKIQWSGVAAAAAQNKVKEKVQQKLGDKLKGLFGR